MFPWMTTYDNIMYGPRARGEDTPQARKQAEFLLEKVGLTAFRKKYPPQLSGGMQRRAELARAMINNPDVMILDEPFRGLDAMSKELMWEYYAGLYEESRRTNFFITTDIDEAIFLADRLIVMTQHPDPRARDDRGHDPASAGGLRTSSNNDHASEVKMRALSLLHEEAMKSFSGAAAPQPISSRPTRSAPPAARRPRPPHPEQPQQGDPNVAHKVIDMRSRPAFLHDFYGKTRARRSTASSSG